MPNIQVVVDRSLPSASLVSRYPSLKGLASDRLSAIEALIEKKTADPTVRASFSSYTEAQFQEAIEFYNAVLRDGRYVDLLASEPTTAATNLQLTVSPEAVEIFQQINSEVSADATEVIVPILVGIGVIVVVDGIVVGVAIAVTTQSAEESLVAETAHTPPAPPPTPVGADGVTTTADGLQLVVTLGQGGEPIAPRLIIQDHSGQLKL